MPQNEPPPENRDWFNKRLIEIGGICEDAGGRPYLRVIWGQEETCYRWGMRCIKYPAVHIKKHFIHGGWAKNIHTGQKIILSRDEAIDVNDQRPVARLPKPEDWIVKLNEEHAVQEVGRHNWIIESLSFRNEADWKAHRTQYGEFAAAAGFDPAQLHDALGEYPRNGVYGECLVIEDDKGKYEPLSEKWLTKLKANIYAAEQTINDSPELSAKKAADRVIEARNKVTEGMRQGVADVYAHFYRQALNLPVVSVPENYTKEMNNVESTDSVVSPA